MPFSLTPPTDIYVIQSVIITTTGAQVRVRRVSTSLLMYMTFVRVSHSVPVGRFVDVNISATHAQLPPKIPPRLISTR